MADKETLDELKKLERDGLINPEDVVAEARNESNPLHKEFEWNDTDAADRYRLIQARTLIRSFKLEVEVREIPLNVARFVRDPADGGGYRDIGDVMRRPTAEAVARRIVTEEMLKVTRAARRARSIATVLGTKADVDEILRIAESVAERARPEITDQPSGQA